MRPEVGDEDITKIRNRVEGVIESTGGHLLKFDDWGQRKLAYEIRDRGEARRYERGLYHYYRYMVAPNTVNEIERNLNILDTVLKYMTVKIEDDLIPEERLARPVEEDIEEIIPVLDEEE
ncbi:MAG: 30S ribosomal protein S6 [Bradymonadaceae bacterium]|nr:30S ribosomal protein S6 [Lujinxingiaceae bacterium]